MKILEAQSAVLTNYEVYTHLAQMKERYARDRAAKKEADGAKYDAKADQRTLTGHCLSLVLQHIHV